MAEITVVCPHCGSTGSYTHGAGATGSDNLQRNCQSCHKSFKVEIRNGQVRQVTK